MAKNQNGENRFKQYHNFLKNSDTVEFNNTVKKICDVLGISETSYYRKLSNPAALSIAERQAIAQVYKLPIHFIFPEMELTA
jgi:hypothetical protein